MALVGNCYIQSSANDPGSVGFGYTWAQTDTANLYFRNSSDTAWVLAGNTDQLNLGLLPISGGTMTGAILGASGLMPLAGGDFTATPTILGDAIATVPYVDAQVSALRASISTQIATAIASIPGLSVGSKIAIGAGIVAMTVTGGGGSTPTGTATIPLPVYGDGTTAVQADVAGRYSAWIARWSWGDETVSSETSGYRIEEVTPNTRNYQAIYTNNSGVPVTPTLMMGYVIIGIKN